MSLAAPQGLPLDPGGTRLYVADDDHHRVVVLDPATLAPIATLGSFGTGPGQFQNPYDVAVDDVSVYVTDRGQNKFFMFTKGTGALVGSFGGRGTGDGQFQDPQGIGFGRGELFVSDVKNDRIQVWCVSSSCGA